MNNRKLNLRSTYRDGGSQEFTIEGTNVDILNKYDIFKRTYTVYLIDRSSKEKTTVELPKAEVVKRGVEYYLEEKEGSIEIPDTDSQIRDELTDLFS